MFDRVREHIGEVIDIADKCPDKYQEKCFEVLLSALVQGETLAVGTAVGMAVAPPGAPVQAAPEVAFFQQNDISPQEWSQVFDYDGSSYSIIVVDLKEKPMSKKQIRLALLLGIKGLLETGEPYLSKDSLIELCREHDAFDATNFSKHMKRNKRWLVPKGEGWNLTVPGKKQAATVIKQLAE